VYWVPEVAQDDDLETVIAAFARFERIADGSRIAIIRRSFFIIDPVAFLLRIPAAGPRLAGMTLLLLGLAPQCISH
jgi:hypothetical protein